MIIEITKHDTELIKELENKFSTIFSSSNKIIDDMKNNIFSKYFIYLQESNIIGFINYYDIYDRFEIANIFVLEEYRNNKVASKLLEHIIALGEIKKITNITLEVKKDNIYAIKLYKKYNFETIALRKRYYNGIDGLLMERKMVQK